MKSLTSIIKDATLEPRNDKMLHFSQHLNHNRHTALYWWFGYPNINDEPWMNTLPLLQGTAIHNEIHRIMDDYFDIDYLSEVAISPHEDTFTYSWTGTADAFITINDKLWLVDYKTISGAGITFLDKPRIEHLLQVSCYYHFAHTQADTVGVLYLPTSADYKRRWHEPVFYEVQPMPKDVLIEHIRSVETDINIYHSTQLLPPWPKGEYKWKENKRNKNYELQYKPHYSSMFCPWRSRPEDEDPCGCSRQKPMLVGKVDYDFNVIEGDEETILAYVAEIQKTME